VKQDHKECKGIVFGHTHLPLYQRLADLLFVLNDGDMRHSATFTVEDEKEFRHMTWDATKKTWRNRTYR